MKSKNLEFRGFVFFGLILVENNPMVIEYNVRLGDPETEVIIPRLNESLSQMILDSKNGKLVSRDANKKS